MAKKNSDIIKIAYLTRNLNNNGISTVIKNYCKYLNKEKYEISVLVGPPVYDANLTFLKSLNINVVITPPKKGKNPFKYYKFIYSFFKKNKYDIVHIHGSSATLFFELVISKLCGIKNRIIHAHSTSCDNKKLHIILRPFLNRLCTCRFACGQDVGKWMFNNKHDFTVIPNGFDVDKFVFDSKIRKKIRTELGCNDKFIIGHVGTFSYVKNHPFIIDFFEKYASIDKDAMLLLIGTGPDYDKINDLINKSEYKEQIICYGPTENVSDFYNAMDLFVLPSRYEGLPIVLLESQINGLYNIASMNITREVNFIGNISYLSIEFSDDWVNKIIELKSKIDVSDRKNVFNENKDKIYQYNITENVKLLEQQYDNLFNKKKK